MSFASSSARLQETIHTIYTNRHSRYGTPCMDQTLRKHCGVTSSLNRIRVRMCAMGLRARAAKRYKVMTDSGHDGALRGKLKIALNKKSGGA